VTQKGPAPPRKRRRLRKWLVRGIVLVVLLALALPYLVSTAPGTRLTVGIVQRFIPGKLSVDDIAIGWLGPCTLAGSRSEIFRLVRS